MQHVLHALQITENEHQQNLSTPLTSREASTAYACPKQLHHTEFGRPILHICTNPDST
jgi:hypothetical protein